MTIWALWHRELIQHLKHWAPGHLYATSLAPPAAQQILSAVKLLRGEDGTDRGARKLAQLRENSDYFRGRLLDMGCNVLGDWGSPVMVSMEPSHCYAAQEKEDCCPLMGARLLYLGLSVPLDWGRPVELSALSKSAAGLATTVHKRGKEQRVHSAAVTMHGLIAVCSITPLCILVARCKP